LTLGRRRFKKRRLTLLKAIGGEECLPSSYRKGKGATYLTNNKKGGEIGDGYLASKPTRPLGIKISLPVLT